MRVSLRILGLFTLGTSLAGCSQTGGFRAVAPSDVKTMASVGDKPVTIVAGRPGEDRRTESDIPDLPRSNAARLSGRVYDEDGVPVRNAVVRLAMNGAAGGKAVHTVTDRSGAFTLRGVRPGSTYTVVAEFQGDDGAMTGRARADAPDTDIEISLRPRDAGLNGDVEVAAAAPQRSRAKPVARRAEFDEDDRDEFDDTSARAVAAAPRPVRPRLDPVPDAPDEFDDLDEDELGWAPGGTVRGANASPPPSPDDYDDADDYSDAPLDLEDDGENPLPPARDISQVSGRFDDDLGSPADEAPRSLPDELMKKDGKANRYGPVQIDEPEPLPDGPPTRSKARKSRRPVQPEDTTSEAPRPTWSEVVSEHQRTVPIDESIAQTTAAALTASVSRSAAAKPKPQPAPAAPPVETMEASQETVAAAPPKPSRTEGRDRPYCDFDFRERRMIDFAMPDMDGKLVSIRDFDADLILLDFWGSWCAPCKTSIPHLAELQKRLGGKKLQVVSLAYEQSKPEERSAKLKEVVQTLGINYPVLVRGYQEDCPVFDALQIQFLPTMILLDREGRILRREQGATETTLARIDRAIAENLDGPKAYARREPIGRKTR